MTDNTRVGKGWVGLEFDGDGMNEQITDEVGKAGPGIEKKGEEHGERYGDGFEGGFFARIRAGFQRGLAQEMQKRAEKDGKDAGGSLGSGLINGLRERLGAGGFDFLKGQLQGDLDAINLRMDELRDKMDRSRSPNTVDRLTASLKEARAESTRLIGQLRTLATQELRNTTRGVSGNGGNDRDRSMGDRIGSLFGAGSRNNGLNLFGKSLGGIINLVNKAQNAVKPLFKAFMEGFEGAAEGASFLQKSMAGLSKAGAEGGALIGRAFAAIAASGPAAVVAIAVLLVTMSALVSVAGALLAITTALVATIASALTGALIVGAGAILAVVAAGGLLVAMFMSLTEAEKTFLKQSFKPLHDELIGIGRTVLNNLTAFDAQNDKVVHGIAVFGVWAQNLQRALGLLQPLAAAAGTGFSAAGDAITRSFSGPGFQMFIATLSTYLPGIIERLSSGLGGFLNGTLALFTAVLPYVSQFSAYLNDVATRFERWTTSVAGQNAITDFVGRALDSLKSLWNFIHQFSGFIGDVLFSPEAQAAGNSIFDSLAKDFAGFRDKIKQAQADGSLQKWFDDAIDFGSKLGDVFAALGRVIGALYDSGVLKAVGTGFGALALVFDQMSAVLGPLIDLLGYVLPGAMALAVTPIEAVAAAVIAIGDAISGVGGLLNKILPGDPFGKGTGSGGFSKTLKALNTIKDQYVNGFTNPKGNSGATNPKSYANSTKSLLGGLGLGALFNGVGGSAGGSQGLGATPQNNPYVGYANSLIKSGPSIAAQVKNAILTINKQIASAIRSASTASDAAAVKSNFDGLIDQIKTSAESTVNTAQQGLNSAAQTLANPSLSGVALAKALAAVRKAQAGVKAALREQSVIDAFAKRLKAQEKVSSYNVNALLDGLKVQNATLADYAAARAKLAVKITDANQKLADAISLRDQYKDQVIQSVQTFGSLITAQAQTINGIEQTLTSGDITSNLQDRLQKIKDFQSNLRILLAQGLSNDAYKQIVDAGVDTGSAYAQALVNGGSGAIGQVNSLVSQITGLADQLGTESSNRLYQAGVDAAQGLVDGLNSLSKQLDSAAAHLGNTIAASLKKALGIKSPSRVMYGLMGYVGDGIEDGLDDQHVKVGRAADRLSDQISVSPAAAEYANRNAASKVSGNSDDPRFRDLIVHTPTEDPKAVAQEVVNEIVGRI